MKIEMTAVEMPVSIMDRTAHIMIHVIIVEMKQMKLGRLALYYDSFTDNYISIGGNSRDFCESAVDRQRKRMTKYSVLITKKLFSMIYN
jgi:hypothetical protein